METLARRCLDSQYVYVLEDSSCLELFMAYLAPGLIRREVGPIEGLRKVLYTGLRDNLAAIFNKGAACKLGERFYCAIADLSFTRAEENHSRLEGLGNPGGARPSE